MAASRTPFHERIKGQWQGLAEDPVQAQSLATELALVDRGLVGKPELPVLLTCRRSDARPRAALDNCFAQEEPGV